MVLSTFCRQKHGERIELKGFNMFQLFCDFILVIWKNRIPLWKGLILQGNIPRRPKHQHKPLGDIGYNNGGLAGSLRNSCRPKRQQTSPQMDPNGYFWKAVQIWRP